MTRGMLAGTPVVVGTGVAPAIALVGDAAMMVPGSHSEAVLTPVGRIVCGAKLDVVTGGMMATELDVKLDVGTGVVEGLVITAVPLEDDPGSPVNVEVKEEVVEG